MRLTIPALTAIALTTSGCASVIADYEAARAAALADPGPPPLGWQPDAVLHLSLPLLNDVVQASLDEQGVLSGSRVIQGPLGLQGSITPSLDVRDLKLVRSKTCDTCLTVISSLAGDVTWSLPPAGGTVPLSIDATFDVGFSTVAEGAAWTVSVRPTEVKKLDVQVAGLGATLGGVSDDLASWAESQILRGVPELPLTRVDTDELPLRALSAEPSTAGLKIAMLTRSPSPTPVATPSAPPQTGWAFDISSDSLVDMVRATAFSAGPLDYEVVPDPTALTLDGDRFELSVRLWRLQGRGWWRDYEVQGTLAPDDDGLALAPDNVEEVAQSPGAVFADPLAALAEGRILDIIADALATPLPASQGAELGTVSAELTVQDVRGANGVVTLHGALAVGDDARARPEDAPAGAGRRGRRPR